MASTLIKRIVSSSHLSVKEKEEIDKHFGRNLGGHYSIPQDLFLALCDPSFPAVVIDDSISSFMTDEEKGDFYKIRNLVKDERSKVNLEMIRSSFAMVSVGILSIEDILKAFEL